MKNFCTLLILIIVIACIKDEEKHINPISVQFIIDSVKYDKYGADMYYKLNVQDGIPPYTFKWINPAENVDSGPFKKKLIDLYTFEVEVSDSKHSYDTVIKYDYDYRDKIIGTYKGLYGYNFLPYYGPQSPKSWVIKTISIEKTENGNLFCNELFTYSMDKIFNLDSTWSAEESFPAQGGKHAWGFRFSFIPLKDSIIYFQDCGSGSRIEMRTFNGSKIIFSDKK